MDIAGFQKNSFVDYPGKIAAVVFCGGCNYNCWYCHNRHILHGFDCIDPAGVYDFLEKRRGQVDAVVFSGGEATLQSGLETEMSRVKGMGYLVKLDTNGARPDVLKKLLEKKLPDYVAMDIKAPFARYAEVTGVDADIAAVKKSIALLMSGETAYEFRTTCVPQFAPSDIEEIAKNIAGARLYALQQYRHSTNDKLQMTNDKYGKVTPLKLPPHGREFFDAAKALAGKYVGNVIVRGM